MSHLKVLRDVLNIANIFIEDIWNWLELFQMHVATLWIVSVPVLFCSER